MHHSVTATVPGGAVPTVRSSIDVEVAVGVAYEEWTRFEDFPQFASSIRSVTRRDETHLRWSVVISGVRARGEAVITEQVPGRLVSWQSTGRVPNRGTVHFTSPGAGRTHIELTVDYEVRSAMVKMAAAMGMDKRLAENLLRGFKRFVEGPGAPGAH